MAVIERDPDAEDALVDWCRYEEGLTPETQVVVGDDEVAVLWADGLLLQLGPGRHELSLTAYPALADHVAFDDAQPLEVAFVRTSNYPLQFHEPVGDLQDKETGLALTFVAACETMDLQVKSAEALIRAMEQFDDEDAFDTFVAEQAVKLTRDSVARQPPAARTLAKAGSSVPADTRDIEAKTNEVLAGLGFGVALRFDDPVLISLDETDAQTVRTYLKL